MKVCKNGIQKKILLKTFRSRSFGFVVAALQCYYRDNGDKIRTSFETLNSSNATTWR